MTGEATVRPSPVGRRTADDQRLPTWWYHPV